MLDVSVKTLDGTNRAYSLQDEITVKEFKEKIAESISIVPDRQRLIFQGRVLQDEKKLSEYNVSGKVIHVVERPPPDMRRPAGSGPPGTGSERSRRQGQSAPPGGGISVGAFGLPDMVDPNHIQNLVQQTLSGMGDVGRNARVTSRTSSDGSAVDVHINLTRNGVSVPSESQQRVLHAHRLLAHIRYTLDQLENGRSSPTQNTNASTSTPNTSTPPVYEASGTAPVNPDLAAPIAMSTEINLSGLTGVRTSSSTQGSTQTVPPRSQSTQTTSSTQSSATSSTQVNTTQSSATQSAPSATQSSPTTTQSAPSVTPSESSSQGAEGASSNVNSGASTSRGATPSSRNEEHPETKKLAELMDELKLVEQRLQPFRDQYYQLVLDDPTLDETARADSQRLYNYVSSCLHHLAHVYHHMSDMMVDFSSQRPRRLRAAANPPPAPTAVIHQTIPVQAQVSLISARPIRSARSRSRGRGQNSSANQNTSQVTTNIPLTSIQSSGASGTTSSSTASATSASGTTTTSCTSSTGTTTSSSTAGGNGGSAPSPFVFPSNGSQAPPVMFMELGPNSVSVNSISTHVVRDGEEPPLAPPTFATPAFSTTPGFATPMGFGPPTGAGHRPAGVPEPPPADFMNNLMRMAQQASTRMGAPRGPMAPPPPPSTTPAQPASASASGSATPTSGSQTPPNGAPLDLGALNGARVPPIVQLDNRSVDPFMICNSRHYLPMRQHPQRQNGEAAVNEVVNNLISSLVQGTGPGGATQGSAADAGTTGLGGLGGLGGSFGAFPSSRAGPVGGAGGAGGATFADAFRNILSQAPPPPPNQGGQETPPGGIGQNQMTDRMFLDMVSGITSNLGQMMAGSGQQGQSLLDFLNTIDPSHNVAMGEGIISEFYMAMAREMTFSDLIQIFSGRAAPLARLRPTLQTFVNERIVQGEEPNEENVDRAIERLCEEENFQASIADVCREANVTVRDDVDFPATVMTFLTHQLRTIIDIVMNATCEGDEFATRLYDQCRSALHELIVLARRCLTNGMDGVDQLVRNRVGASALSVANPMIRTWLVNTSSMNVRSLTPQIAITDRDVQHYIVTRQQSESMDVDTTPTTTPPPGEATPPSSQRTTPPANMTETTSAPSDSEDSYEDAASSMDGSSIGRTISESSMETEGTPGGAQGAAGAQGGAARAPEPDWRQVVPQEWVPVIQRDAENQRGANSQAPFSDAYINGMPAKRRRVMLQENSLVAPGDRNVPAILNQSIRDAMRLTGIRPLTSVDSLQRDLAANTDNLTVAYQEQVIEDIQKRLRDDPDYSSKRFPNTEKYFKGKGK